MELALAGSQRMPTLFLPHGGGPWPFMEWDPPDLWASLEEYLRSISASLGRLPKAVLVISAHWEERIATIQTATHPKLLFDYSGFPPSTYQVTYPAPGSAELATRTRGLLSAAGCEVGEDQQRGFDHGTFVPFKLIYPDANVPLVQLSLLRNLQPAAHLAIGAALQPLRDEGVLIVGSGMSYHNLRAFFRPSASVHGDSVTFDTWLTETVTNPSVTARNAALSAWSQAPAARAAHPREEHLLPLMVAAGAAGSDVGRRVYSGQIMGISLSGFQFGK